MFYWALDREMKLLRDLQLPWQFCLPTVIPCNLDSSSTSHHVHIPPLLRAQISLQRAPTLFHGALIPSGNTEQEGPFCSVIQLCKMVPCSSVGERWCYSTWVLLHLFHHLDNERIGKSWIIPVRDVCLELQNLLLFCIMLQHTLIVRSIALNSNLHFSFFYVTKRGNLNIGS